MMSDKRTRKTIEKQKAIYDSYIEILKPFGPRAARMDKRDFYSQVAERFFVEPDYVRKVVNGMGQIKTKAKGR